MSPELQMLLQSMHDDIRAIDGRTQLIEQSLAQGEGARKLWAGLHRMLSPLLAALAGAAAGHYWPNA